MIFTSQHGRLRRSWCSIVRFYTPIYILIAVLVLTALEMPEVARHAFRNKAALEITRSANGGYALDAGQWPDWFTNDPDIQLLEARALLLQGEVERARSLLKSMEDGLSGRTQILRWVLLARGHERAGEYEKAREVYLALGSADYLANLARRAAEDGSLDAAIRYMSWAVVLQSDRADFLAALADWHFAQGERDTALSDWREAVSLAPEDAHYQVQLAATLALQGYLDEAESLLNHLVQGGASGLRGEDYFRIGMLYWGSLDIIDKALYALEKAVGLDPANPIFRTELGRACQDSNRYAEAQFWFESVALDPESPALRRGLAFERMGNLAEVLNNSNKAIGYYEDALRQFALCEDRFSLECAESTERVAHRLSEALDRLP